MQLSPAQVRELLSFFQSLRAHAEEAERRASVRLQIQAHLEIAPAGPEQPSRSFTALLLDVSADGLCFSCDHDLAVGGRFTVRLPVSSDRSARILCTVVNKSESAGSARIGACFDELLMENGE